MEPEVKALVIVIVTIVVAFAAIVITALSVAR